MSARARRTAAAGAAVVLAASIAATVLIVGSDRERPAAPAVAAVADPALSGDVPLRDCGSRAEGGRQPDPAAREANVELGPISFWGLKRLAGARGLKHYRSGAGYALKAAVELRAGTEATLVVGRSAREWVSLSFAARRVGRVSDGDPAVRFRACPRDEPAFSNDGKVGATTGFAGGFILDRAGCVPLEVHVAGQPTRRMLVPFGVGSCGEGG